MLLLLLFLPSSDVAANTYGRQYILSHELSPQIVQIFVAILDSAPLTEKK